MADEQHEGATPNEQLLSAARTDNEEMLLVVFEYPDKFDINFTDGLGNTEGRLGLLALHYAAQSGSAIVLEHLLAYEGCDVDLQNRLENNTPLHMAVKYLMDPEERNEIVESLLDAGANTKIKDKNGDVIYDIVSSSSKELDDTLRYAIRRAQALEGIEGIAGEDDEDEEDSGSGSETD